MTSSRYGFLFKNVGILTISNFASKILVFLLVPLYTAILSTEEVGIYDLAVTSIQMITPIATLNIIDGVMRFAMDHKYNKSQIASIGLKYVFIGAVLSFVFFLIAENISVFSGFKGWLILVSFYSVSYIFYQYTIQFTKAIENVFVLGIAGIISTIVMVSSNIFLLVFYKTGLSGFFISSILSQIVPAFFIIYKIQLWKYILFNVRNRELEKRMVLYSMPLIFTTIGWIINNASDKFVVTYVCGYSANGLLSVSYKIPSIINTIQTIFMQAWQISAIKEFSTRDSRAFFSNTFLYLNGIMSFCCFGLIFFTKYIAHFLYVKDFYAAWEFVPFLLVSSVINTSSGFLGPILAAKMNSKSMANSAIWGSIVNIVLNVIFVNYYGIQGATIATVISSFIIFLIRLYACHEDVKKQIYIKAIVSWILLCIQAYLEIISIVWLTQVFVLVGLLLLYINQIRNGIIIGKHRFLCLLKRGGCS